jgi:hypothetical protein
MTAPQPGTCPARAYSGVMVSVCSLPAGHEGDHEDRLPNGRLLFRWSTP